MKYYVYELRRPWGTPFYVGKGQGDRADQHFLESHNSDVQSIIDEIKQTGGQPKIEISLRTPDESEALTRESELILRYGRVDINTGPLVNKNNGSIGEKQKEKRLAVDVSLSMHQQLKTHSAITGLSVKSHVTAALKQYFERENS